ncbi:Ecdysteroid kinase-like family [Popillia japonica]|uniref:Ecdysteroid kinase-like family n=1 Tax=Popillia japonica TaxID=7064 RepID=A0AAW1JFZ0_POPJA
MSIEIKQLQPLVKSYLKPGQKFVSYECKSLLSTGENYGSTMLSILIKISNEDGKEETIPCIGKTVPPSQFLWDFFNTKNTFKKEIAVYNTIVPELNKFGNELGIDCLMDFFAKCAGARLSLDPKSEEVDADAFIILENLKTQGYESCDRLIGFNEDCTKLLLGDLATMHAATIAYRLAKPDEFKTKVLPHLKRQYAFDPPDDVINDIMKSWQKAAGKNPKCIPYLGKIEEAVRNIRYYLDNPPKGKDMFATMTHNDYWVNNTLIKFVDGKPVKNAMVDFQIMEFGSLAHDVIFFLYSSVELSLLERKVDEFIQLYYEKFIQNLVRLKCDIIQYSYEAMLEEFALIANRAQFTHILYMLTPILTAKGKAADLSDFGYSNFILNEDLLHENYFKRLHYVVLDFVRKGWI